MYFSKSEGRQNASSMYEVEESNQEEEIRPINCGIMLSLSSQE